MADFAQDTNIENFDLFNGFHSQDPWQGASITQDQVSSLHNSFCIPQPQPQIWYDLTYPTQTNVLHNDFAQSQITHPHRAQSPLLSAEGMLGIQSMHQQVSLQNNHQYHQYPPTSGSAGWPMYHDRAVAQQLQPPNWSPQGFVPYRTPPQQYQGAYSQEIPQHWYAQQQPVRAQHVLLPQLVVEAPPQATTYTQEAAATVVAPEIIEISDDDEDDDDEPQMIGSPRPVSQASMVDKLRKTSKRNGNPDWYKSYATIALQSALFTDKLPANLAKAGKFEEIAQMREVEAKVRLQQFSSTIPKKGKKQEMEKKKKSQRAPAPLKGESESNKKRKEIERTFGQKDTVPAAKKVKSSRADGSVSWVEPLTAAKVRLASSRDLHASEAPVIEPKGSKAAAAMEVQDTDPADEEEFLAEIDRGFASEEAEVGAGADLHAQPKAGDEADEANDDEFNTEWDQILAAEAAEAEAEVDLSTQPTAAEEADDDEFEAEWRQAEVLVMAEGGQRTPQAEITQGGNVARTATAQENEQADDDFLKADPAENLYQLTVEGEDDLF